MKKITLLLSLILTLALAGTGWTAPDFSNTVTYGTDIITNHNFAVQSPWANTGTTANTYDYASPAGYPGTSSTCVKCAATAANGGTYWYPSAATGAWYLVSAWVYIDNSTSGGAVYVTFDNNTIATVSGSAGSWVHVQRLYRYTASSANFYFRQSGSTATTFYATAVSVLPVTMASTIGKAGSVVNTTEDFDLSIGVTFPTSPSFNPVAGMMLNIDNPANPQNYVFVYSDANKGNIVLDKCVNGTYSNVYTKPSISYSANATLKVIKSGTQYTVYYGGGSEISGVNGVISDASIIHNTIHAACALDSSAVFDRWSGLQYVGPGPPVLVPQNFWTFTATDADSRGVWGDYGTSAVSCIENGTVTTVQGAPLFNSFNFDGSAETLSLNSVWLTANPNNILVAAEASTGSNINKWYIFLSTNGGVTFSTTPVIKLGSTDHTTNGNSGTFANQTTNVGVLVAGKLSCCVLGMTSPGGAAAGTIYISEYNTNGSRTPGGTNDRVNLWQSTDNGGTFTEVTHWNADGSNNNITHIHSVQQDPYTGYIYIICGDPQAQCSIIRWDGATAIPVNTTPSNYSQSSGLLSVGGQYYYKGINILFTPNYIHWFSDNADVASGDVDGIYRANRDLTGITKMAAAVGTTDVGWMGWTIGSTMYFSNASSTRWVNIWASNDEGSTWKIVNRYGVNGAGQYMIGAPQYGGYLYLSCGYASGARSTGRYCSQLVQGANWQDYQPQTIHPTYWVKTSGNDSTGNGLTPATAWLTLKHALEGSNIVTGGRIILDAATYSENSITPAFSSTYAAAAPTTITGQGNGSTALVKASNGSNIYFLNFANATGLITFSDLSISSLATGDANEGVVSSNGAVELDRCVTGPNYSGGVNWLNQGGTFITKATKIQSHAAAAASVQINTTASVVKMFYSITTGAVLGVDFGVAGSVLSLLNDDFYGYSTAGLQIESGADNPPKVTVLNDAFKGGASTYPINNLATSFSSNNIDYNCFDQALNGITSDGSHNLATTDPKFTAPPTYFALSPTSLAKQAGFYAGLPWDFVSRSVGVTPNMGAMEGVAGGGGMGLGMGMGLGGFPGWQHRPTQ